MKKDALAVALDQARALRDHPDEAGLRRALSHKHGWVVAIAAEIVREKALEPLLDDVAAAYGRLFEDAAKRDPSCKGKVACAQALDAASWLRPEPFERGASWQQHEPTWGGTTDTAPPLRATCLFALARIGPSDVWSWLADGLGDANPNVRSAAARAIAWRGDPHVGVPLLRLFCGQGDPEGDGEVLADALIALLQLDGSQIGWVVKRLASEKAGVRQAAALALGEARLTEAFEPLKAALGTADREDRRVLFLAIAMLRHPPATEWLLELARGPDRSEAYATIGALSVQAHDPKVQQALEEIARTKPMLRDAVRRALRGESAGEE